MNKPTTMKRFFLQLALMIVIASSLAIVVYIDSAEAQVGGNWKWQVDSSCGFRGNAQITKYYEITDDILVYTAVIQAGSCKLDTDLRYIQGVTTSNENTIQSLIDADLDAWAQEVGTVTINAPQSLRKRGSGSTTRT